MTNQTHKEFAAWYQENQTRFTDFGSAQRAFMADRGRPRLRFVPDTGDPATELEFAQYRDAHKHLSFSETQREFMKMRRAMYQERSDIRNRLKQNAADIQTLRAELRGLLKGHK